MGTAIADTPWHNRNRNLKRVQGISMDYMWLAAGLGTFSLVLLGWLFAIHMSYVKRNDKTLESLRVDYASKIDVVDRKITHIENRLEDRVREVEHSMAKNHLDKNEIKDLLREILAPLQLSLTEVIRNVQLLSVDLPKNYTTNQALLATKQEMKDGMDNMEKRILTNFQNTMESVLKTLKP